MTDNKDQKIYYVDQQVEVIKTYPIFNLSKIRIIKTNEILNVRTAQLQNTKSAETYLTIKL